MKLPRDLSGLELIQILSKHFDYRVIHQTGSHVILETEKPTHQRISVPDHKPLRTGTLNSILRSIARHKQIEKDELLDRL